MELSDRNGLVSHENERHGRPEVRRDAKTIRLRQSQRIQDDRAYEACAFFLAVAATPARVPGTRERSRSARTAVGFNSPQGCREEQEKSPRLSLPDVRWPQSFRSPSLSSLLASHRKKITRSGGSITANLLI